MWVITGPLGWLQFSPGRMANDARLSAENDRIDGIAERRIAEWDRRQLAIEREHAGALDDWRKRTEYYARFRAEHDRYMNEPDEERRWRSAARDACRGGARLLKEGGSVMVGLRRVLGSAEGTPNPMATPPRTSSRWPWQCFRAPRKAGQRTFVTLSFNGV